MICPKCNLSNEEKYSFCVNCGTTLLPNSGGYDETPPTVQLPPDKMPPTQHYSPANSVETSVLPQYQQEQTYLTNPNASETPKKSKTVYWIGGLFLLLLLLGGGAAAYFLTQESETAEVLPDHFGLFFQNQEKTKVGEIKKQEFSSLLTAKEDFEKNEDLPVLDEKPNLILFSANDDIPLNDLKLVEIGSIKDDGSLNQFDFQAAPVDNKTDMKRMRVPEALADGKYAFAIFDGFFDEGKYKLWAFQIKNSSKSDNGDLAKNKTLPLKSKDKETEVATVEKPVEPKETPVQKEEQKVSPPSGASVATMTENNVVMRSAPTQSSAKIGAFKRGQKVFVIRYSNNYEDFKNLSSNFAYVQTESGKRGWVYAAFIR